MPLGPGKYDDLCTLVRKRAKAVGVIVMVIGGSRGSGFSLQLEGDDNIAELQRKLPEILENMAQQIRESLAE